MPGLGRRWWVSVAAVFAVTAVALPWSAAGTKAHAAVPRPRAERVPSGVRSLLINLSERQSSGGVRSGITFRYTVTDAAEIAQITRWIDALPIVSPGQTSCTTHLGTSRSVRLTFTGAAGATLATATARTNSPKPSTACNTVAFTVRGHPSLPLADAARLIHRFDRLLLPGS